MAKNTIRPPMNTDERSLAFIGVHQWPAFSKLPFAAALCCAALFAQPAQYTILPFAGVSLHAAGNVPATAALLNDPHGIATGPSGEIIIADTSDNLIRRVSASGTISDLTDQAVYPWGAAVGPSGDVYVADAAHNRILRISPSGSVNPFAGSGTAGGAGVPGPAAVAQLNSPRGVAVDAAGNVYILDTGNDRVLKASSNGNVVLYAGSGGPGYAGDGGPANQAYLNFPYGIALDTAGDLFIADTLNQRIRVVTPDGNINTIAGINERGFNSDGAALATAFNYPGGLAVDSAGTLYVADTGNNILRKITQPLGGDAQVVTIAGNGLPGFTGDGGSARSAQLNSPFGVSIDAQGDILVADSGNHRIRRIDARGNIMTIAGADHAAGDGGRATSARLFAPSGLALDATGNVYIADTDNDRVRRVSTDGTISLAVAGLSSPNGLAFDSAGALYIADTAAHVIRKLSNGTITVVAGVPGKLGNDGDEGLATDAHLETPNAVAFDHAGNMYIADSGNNRIRVVTRDGKIHAFAGDSDQGLPGYDGDNGPAMSAHLNYPRDLLFDSQDNLYVADFFNDRVRMISAGSHIIRTIAGTGVRGGAGIGGPATQAQLALPAGLAFDKQGNLYIADSLNNRICVITGDGNLRTIAGSAGAGDSGDGSPAIGALLASPRGLAVDAKGVVYFSDQDNNRVRTLVPGLVSVSAVVNAASLVGGKVAPGELVTIYGALLAPDGVASSVPASAATLATAAANTQVFFDDVPAPLLYVSGSQINAIVPYEVAGRATTDIVVDSQGKRSDPLTVPVVDAAPGIFSNSVGAALNQDGSQNSPSNPAKAGDVVVFFATGEGQTEPAGVTGKLAQGANLPTPALPVSLEIGGKAAQLVYAGEMPFGAGVLQINAVVPEGVGPGAAAVTLSIGSEQGQSGITLNVR